MALSVFEEDLLAYMKNSTDLPLTFTGGIWPGKAQAKETRPQLIIEMVKRTRDKILTGVTGKEERIYCFYVWGPGYTDVKRNAELVVFTFDQKKLNIGPFTVVCFLDDQKDHPYDHNAQLHGIQTDFEFKFMKYPS